MTSNTSPQATIFEILAAWLKSLPTDIKILIEMIGDNELKMEARNLAVGLTFYIISPIDVIPEKIGIIGFVDDVVVLHIGLATILEIDPDRADHYREKYAEACAVLDEEIQVLKLVLGALNSWLKALVGSLRKRTYRGQSTEDVTGSQDAQEEIFDEAMEYAARVNVDPDAIERALLGAPPERIARLLSQGLEKDQRYQAKNEETGLIKGLSDAKVSFQRRLGMRSSEDATDATGLVSTGDG